MAKKRDHSVFESLGQILEQPPPPKAVKNSAWHPRLTPSQQKLFESNNRYILCWGAKAGAKSYGCLSKLVRHCYENENALALILVRVRSMANKGGAWDKLQNEVLPRWKHGNTDPQGNKIDEGLGLEFSDVKFDSQHNEFIWIQNEFGGWSMVVLISAPHATQLRERIRGYEPSFVFVDELTSCDSVEYFQAVAAQIGRRAHVDGVQQYVAACNPEGQSHWVYQKWFVQAFDEETGEWDPDFENIPFMVAENVENLPPDYLPSLKKIFKDDKVEGQRMMEGEWVDRPSGEGLFRDIYDPITHVQPLNEEMQPHQFEWLQPVKGHTMIIGLDPGAVYSSFVFMQWLPIDGNMKWLVFDELVVTKQKIAYELMVPMVMRRVKFWREEIGADPTTLPQVWISDDSAFNQYRAATGSFDVLEIEKIYEAFRVRYGLEPMRVKSAPKFNGSRLTSVRLIQSILAANQIVVSSLCRAVNRMFLQIQGKKQKAGEVPDPEAAMTPAPHDPNRHTFDALRYPILAASLNPTALVPSTGRTQTLVSAA